MTPNILVVGAGWYGCYIAYMLKNTGYSVRIIEKESEIMTQTSTHNQNRLHLGFHYMRSFHTRDECLRGYDTFMNDFSFLTRPVPCNLYIVHKKSLLDTETIHQILDLHRIPYDNYPLEYVQSYLHLDNIQDILLTHERIIDPFLSKQFFEQELKDILWPSTSQDNVLKNRIQGCRIEQCLSLVYKCNIPFFDKGLTVIDGPFFSLYPYYDSYYTLTHVTHTVIHPNEATVPLPSLIAEKRLKMETDVLSLFPHFLSYFTYHNFFISQKIKKMNIGTDDRSIDYLCSSTDSSISVCGGKITGIFDAYKQVVSCLSMKK